METVPPQEEPLSPAIIVVLAMAVIAIPLILIVIAKLIERNFSKAAKSLSKVEPADSERALQKQNSIPRKDTRLENLQMTEDNKFPPMPSNRNHKKSKVRLQVIIKEDSEHCLH